MLAPFRPCAGVSEASQKDYYAFVSELLDTLFAQPELLFGTLHEDDAHPNRFNCASYGKPKLKADMNAIDKKLQALFALLHQLGSGKQAAATLCKPKLQQLAALGLTLADGQMTCARHPALTEAWQYLAATWPEGAPGFERCWFDPAWPYMETAMARLYDAAPYKRLTTWINENGYKQYPCVTRPDALDYAKSVKSEETPLGYAIHGDKDHYGFTLEYRYEARVPQHFEVRLLRFADLLKRCDQLSKKTQQMILTHVKHCDGCRYCVQTDKTGKRPLAAIPLGGEKLCPLFPGFSFARSELTMDETEGTIALLTDMERMLLEAPPSKKKWEVNQKRLPV